MMFAFSVVPPPIHIFPPQVEDTLDLVGSSMAVADCVALQRAELGQSVLVGRGGGVGEWAWGGRDTAVVVRLD